MNPDIKPIAVSTWYKPIKHFDDFQRTAAKHGIELHNCDDTDWGGLDWTKIQWWKKIEAQHRFITEHPEPTHFMFTDSYDIVFAAGWDEIMAKYLGYQSPIVFGTECYCWPRQDQAPLYPQTPMRSKFLNAGMWIGERQAALQLLEEAVKMAATHTKCDSGIFVDLFLSKRFPVKLDNSCSLLFCCNMDSLEYLEKAENGRPRCKDTGEYPCVFHGNGSSPVNEVIEMLQ